MLTWPTLQRAQLRFVVLTVLVTQYPQESCTRFISAFMKVSSIQHPRVHFETVQVADLMASTKALEDGKVDLAIVRSDVAPPTNGQTIVILRRDVIAFVLPPDSSVDKVASLDGKTIGIPAGPQQEYNAQALDTILSYYNIAPKSVKRVVLPLAEIGQAVHQKHVAAILAVGPMGVVDVVAAVGKATKAAPGLLAIDEADAINSRFPAFESIDVPQGAPRGKPPTPDDTVTTLAVTYRLVAPITTLNFTAGAIGQSIFTKEIEAPDPDDKNPALPVHPGERHI
jgi:TRAP-type uncharacterized transport system substrate-binding protein